METDRHPGTADRPAPSARWTRGALAAVAWLVLAPAHALTLPPVLSDGVVFQRGKPVRVWGTALPREQVSISWGNARIEATAGEDGRWRGDLPGVTQAAGDIVVRDSRGTELRIRDAVLGQVWLCGGQSNMSLPLKRTDGSSLAGRPLAAPAALRLYRAPHPVNPRPNEGRWTKDDPAAASGFSAVCYLTGRLLAEHTGDTIGLVDTSVGGTRLDAWTPTAASRTARPADAARASRGSINAPARAFDAVALPVAPVAASGMLWYQGEGDYRRNSREYAALFVAAIRGWRDLFDQPDLPVYYVQLPPFAAADPQSGWEEVRSQQAKAEQMLPQLYMAPSNGMVARELHAPEKVEVARRLFDRILASGNARR